MPAGGSAISTRLTLSFRPVPISIAVHLSTAVRALLADGELRLLALGHVSFGTRQRRADQAPVHGTFVLEPFRRHVLAGVIEWGVVRGGHGRRWWRVLRQRRDV